MSLAPRLLLDTADPDVWRELWPLGLFRGITTNPTLLRRSGRFCDLSAIGLLVAEALDIGCQELHLQSWGATETELLACGRALVSLAPEQVVVKLPLSESGLRAARVLLGEGERVTLTACYTAPQVIAAAADQASPPSNPQTSLARLNRQLPSPRISWFSPSRSSRRCGCRC